MVTGPPQAVKCPGTPCRNSAAVFLIDVAVPPVLKASGITCGASPKRYTCVRVVFEPDEKGAKRVAQPVAPYRVKRASAK